MFSFILLAISNEILRVVARHRLASRSSQTPSDRARKVSNLIATLNKQHHKHNNDNNSDN